MFVICIAGFSPVSGIFRDFFGAASGFPGPAVSSCRSCGSTLDRRRACCRAGRLLRARTGQEIAMTAVDGLGYLAAALVLATFCAKSMVPLRALAIASNIAFVSYGFFDGLWPILLLHSVMLPMNTMRLREAVRSQNQALLRPPPSLRPTSAAGKQHSSQMGHAARLEPV
jgi:hypothetical protein